VNPAVRHEHFQHGADIGIRGIGPRKEEAFRQALEPQTHATSGSRGLQTSSADPKHDGRPEVSTTGTP